MLRVLLFLLRVEDLVSLLKSKKSEHRLYALTRVLAQFPVVDAEILTIITNIVEKERLVLIILSRKFLI